MFSVHCVCVLTGNKQTFGLTEVKKGRKVECQTSKNAAYQIANRTNLMIEREPVEPDRLINALALELIIY